MKKILSILLVLVFALTAFVSCDKIPGLEGMSDKLNFEEILNKVKFWEKDETPSVTLDDAKAYLFNTYKDSAKAPVVDYDLVAVVTIDGVKFSVTWTVDLDTITIKESNKANFWTVDLPDVNEEEKAYNLTATIADAEGNKIEVKFAKTLPVIDISGVETMLKENVAYKLYVNQLTINPDGYKLFAKNQASNDQNKYIATTTNPLEAAEYFVEIVGDGYKVYTMVDGAKMYLNANTVTSEDGKISKYLGLAAESEAVYVYDSSIQTFIVTIDGLQYGVGTYGSYDTLSISDKSYFKPENINVVGGQYPLTFMLAETANALTPSQKPVVNDPAADSTLTIAQALELGKSKANTVYTEGKYYVTGTVKEIQNTTYGNLVITDGTNDLLVYGTYDATGANRFDAMATQPAVGDTITVYGVIGKYSDKPQMKNGWITAHTPAQGGGTVTPPTPSTPAELEVVTAPVAGVAYKLGLFHGNENADVFFNGQNYNNYAWYLAYGNAAAAVDVYLEEVEGVDGAYRLYFMNGEAKTYIRVYQDTRDGHEVDGTMELTTTVPTEYFTYNAEYKTLIWTNANGDQTFLGSSGTYKSISCNRYSNLTKDTYYPVHFYAEKVAHTCDFVAGTPVAPTCTADGYTVYTCSICGATENRDTVPAAHTWVDATCTAPKTCSVCQATEGEPAAHTFVEGICSGCGLAETHVCNFVATEKVVAPTCTEGGYTVYECTCGLTENRDQLDALGHAWDNGVVTDPTCTAAGFTTFTCGTCQETKTEAGDPVVDHADADNNCFCDTCNALVNFGTLEAPLTATQAQAIGASLASGAYTAQKVYVTGTVTGIGTVTTYYKNVYVSDGTTEFLIFSINLSDGINGFVVGDTITAYGYIQNYNGNTPEMTGKSGDYPYALVVTPHTCQFSDPTCTEAAKCTLCNAEGAAALGHTTEEGTCERCGETIGSQAPVKSYNKVTSAAEFTTGTYVLVGNTSNVTFSETHSSGWVLGTALSSMPDAMDQATGDQYAITLTVTDAGVAIKVGDVYIAPKGGNNNGMKLSTTAYYWAYSFDSNGNITFKGTGSDTVTLAYNSTNSSTNSVGPAYRGYKNTTASGSTYYTTFVAYKLG